MAQLPPDLEQTELKKRAMRRLAVAIALVAAAVAVLVLLGRNQSGKPAVVERPAPEIAPPFIVPPPAETPPEEPPAQQPEAAPEAAQQPAPTEQPAPVLTTQPAAKPQAAPPPPEVVNKTLPKPGEGASSKPQSMAAPPATRSAPAAQAAPPAPADKPTLGAKRVEAPQTNGFVVQLGVFTNYANARQLQERLAQNGIKSYTETRVHVGPFRDKAEAEQALAKIKAMGISAVVVAH